ncbi:ABC transporter substrate-binding protein [Acidilobus saccharovorans]|uniref:ABC transporter substrate-binding protein n=1 Tax=Acidilobus saccharovorans TaxID=242703 RepID=UPI0013050F11|nr:ABC transporter substrate-binding protein [Acidilobus saccharovorans]
MPEPTSTHGLPAPSTAFIRAFTSFSAVTAFLENQESYLECSLSKGSQPKRPPGLLRPLNVKLLSPARAALAHRRVQLNRGERGELLAPPEGNVSGAIHWLEAHGWRFVNGQLYAPNGTDVSDIQMTIIEPSGEADYDESAVLIADELKAIGLNVVPETLPFSTWFSDLLSGDYWMARFWGMGAVPVAAQQFLARLSPKTTNESAMGFGGFMWINLSQYPFMEYINEAMQY